MPETFKSHLTNRSLLRLTGADVNSFLQNLITNDIEKLKPDSAIYSALLTPQGKFLYDFFVIEWAGQIYLDCLKEHSASLVKKLSLYKLRADVTITDVSNEYKIIAYFGAGTAELLSQFSALKQPDTLIYADPRRTEIGLRMITIAEPSAQENNLTEIDLPAYIKHRLRLGIPEGGRDITSEKNFLLETNFEELNGVSFSKGCYVGQELTARTKHRAKIKKRLFQFTFDGNIAIGDTISSDGIEIATVCAFEAPYGLALTRLSQWRSAIREATQMEPAGIILKKPDYVILPPAED